MNCSSFDLGNILELVYFPIAKVLHLCYMLLGNYGWAIILFSVIAKVCLFPLAIKGEKSRLQQAKFQPKVNELQKRYKGNTRDPKYNEELQALYQKEGFSPTSGCLPSLIQFPLILALWNAIRRPLYYISGFTLPVLYSIAVKFFENGIAPVSTLFKSVEGITENIVKTYDFTLAQMLNNGDNLNLVKDLIPADFKPINFDFYGLNLGDTPSNYGILSWYIILPIICGATSFFVSWISTKINASDTPNQAKVPGMNAMLYTMPILSAVFAYSFNIGICLYLIVSNALSIAQVFILKAVVKKPEEAPKKVKKEKKLNYNQIEKMKREKINEAFGFEDDDTSKQ